jgi:Flp pilus assembly protein TadB
VLSVIFALTIGTGIFLVYDALTAPAPADPPARVGLLDRLRGFLLEAGLPDRAWEFVFGSMAFGLLAAWAALATLGWPVLSLALGVGVGLIPTLLVARLADCRQAALRSALPDALTQLRDVLRGGLSVQGGLEVLAHDGPEVLRPELTRLLRDARLGGASGFADAVYAARSRLSHRLWDLVTAALLLDDRQGGGLSQSFDELARAARLEVQALEEVQTYRSHVEWEARILAGLPLVLLIAGRLVSPAYFSVYDGLSGQLWLAISLCLLGAGYVAMRWFGRLAPDPRVLVEARDV